MTRLSFNDKYELELAIDAANESEAKKRLSRIFGKEVTDEINKVNLSKHGDLYFVRHHFASSQLSDENYNKLKKDNKILVLSDSLAIERAKKLLEYCLPVEVQLKKLLTYVYPSIMAVFDGKTDKKSRIALCKQINSWYLGDLLGRLEIDITLERRKKLFIEDGNVLTDILKSSKTFDDFRNTILKQIQPNMVWDQVCVVLEKPVNYLDIKDKLHSLRYLRDKAAHPQIILDSDVKLAKEYSEIIMSRICGVKNNYGKELSKSIRSLEEVLSEIARACTMDMQKIMNGSVCAMPNLSEDIKKLTDSINSANPVLAMKGIDWLAIDSEIRRTDPELEEETIHFESDDGAKSIVKKIGKLE